MLYGFEHRKKQGKADRMVEKYMWAHPVLSQVALIIIMPLLMILAVGIFSMAILFPAGAILGWIF